MKVKSATENQQSSDTSSLSHVSSVSPSTSAASWGTFASDNENDVDWIPNKD